MFKIAIAYVLLVASFAGPPLLLVSVPLAVYWTRKHLRERRSTVALATSMAEQKSHDQMVRFFR